VIIVLIAGRAVRSPASIRRATPSLPSYDMGYSPVQDPAFNRDGRFKGICHEFGARARDLRSSVWPSALQLMGVLCWDRLALPVRPGRDACRLLDAVANGFDAVLVCVSVPMGSSWWPCRYTTALLLAVRCPDRGLMLVAFMITTPPVAGHR
jgi:hypothetical protein